MPTYDKLPAFLNGYRSLAPEHQERFFAAVRALVADLQAHRPFRQSLRIKAVQGHAGIFEVTWEWPNGRATFEYGQEQVPGEPHIIWRRIGGHDIFGAP